MYSSLFFGVLIFLFLSLSLSLILILSLLTTQSWSPIKKLKWVSLPVFFPKSSLFVRTWPDSLAAKRKWRKIVKMKITRKNKGKDGPHSTVDGVLASGPAALGSILSLPEFFLIDTNALLRATVMQDRAIFQMRWQLVHLKMGMATFTTAATVGQTAFGWTTFWLLSFLWWSVTRQIE